MVHPLLSKTNQPMQLKVDNHPLSLIISGPIQGLKGDSFSARKWVALAHNGLADIKLTTDRLDNETVNQFYLCSGFHLTSSCSIPGSREMNEHTTGLQDFALHE